MRFFIFLILISMLNGCQWQRFEFGTKEELKKEVIDKDPAFAALLDKKAKLDEQVAALQSEFNEKSKQIKGKISELKEALISARRDIDAKINDIDAQLTPFREEIKSEIKELIAQLKLKESSLATTNATISKLNKLIQQGSSFEDLSKDTSKWQDKIASLKTTAEELQKEISSLRDKIRLGRLKLKLLR